RPTVLARTSRADGSFLLFGRHMIMASSVTKAGPTSVGNYDLLDKIGVGGMGSVYRARDRQTGGIVAVKILRVQLSENPEQHYRFAQEFRAATKLEHPNIVRAIEFGTDGKHAFLVAEYVDGIDLGVLIEERG